MPVTASSDTIALLPNAALDLVEHAGHFVWFEGPGSVRAALQRLIADGSPSSNPESRATGVSLPATAAEPDASSVAGPN